MANKADMLWEEVLELEESGEREEALDLCRQITRMEPTHAAAWKMTARMTLPAARRGVQDMPTLAQAASAYAALQNVVRLEPGDAESWAIGGNLLVDHLGMLEEALGWWQQRRQIDPNDVTPLIEQIAILVRLGMYSEASELLEIMFESEMEQPDRQQLMNIDRVRQMVDKAAKMEKDEIFRPQNSKHPRWEIIGRMKTRKPLSDTFFLFTFVAPIVFLMGTVAMTLLGGSQFGFILVFVIILGLFMGVSRAAAGLLHRLNRHALDLERALMLRLLLERSVCQPKFEVVNSTIIQLENEVLLSRIGIQKLLNLTRLLVKSGNQTCPIFLTQKIGGQRMSNQKIDSELFLMCLQNNPLDRLVAHLSNYQC